MNFLQALILAFIEGITEFLPISSTGHLIITSSLMGIASDDFTKLFSIAIQFGAILSVLVLYFKRFFRSYSFYLKLLLGFIPAAILGKLLNDWIDSLLENVIAVAITLLAGGIILIFIDRWFRESEKNGAKEPGFMNSFKIGLFQCLALVPGVSRSAATIIGGLAGGLTRTGAAEFSFFLAVPTMFAATVYKLFNYWKEGHTFSQDQMGLLVMGNLVAFLVAIVAMKSFVTFLNRHGFKMFGWYRIGVGVILLSLYFAGIEIKIA